jgi:hypothetical protein
MTNSQITIKKTQINIETQSSPCGNFRYLLSRKWGNSGNMVAFICENPSIADEVRLDPTFANCVTLSVNWGFDGIHMLNVYPYYSTKPENLIVNDETTETNIAIIRQTIESVSRVVLAPGQHHKKIIKKLIAGFPEQKFFCLKKNNDGSFLHPGRISIPDYPQPIPAFP